METAFVQGLMQEPLWLKIWVGWMIVINTASILFIKHQEGRVALGAWIGNGIFMTVLAEANGYNRLLGLSHIIWWTPLVVYLFQRRREINYRSAFGQWVAILLLTNAVSLVIDYIDIIRYVLGDRT